MSIPNVADFFLRVVAWPAESEPGYINIHWRSANVAAGMPGRPFRSVVELMTNVQKFLNRPKSILDIYFCLGRQLETGRLDTYGKPWAKRSKNNTAAMKCIALDVDVKPEKGYANAAEAIAAVQQFVTAASLPLPSALVYSGGGLHVYWISDRPLSLSDWTPYASGLRALADHHGLRFDPSVTIDCARVLRVPGTYNLKETVPRPVTLKYLAPADLNFETALGHIRSANAGPVAPRDTAAAAASWDFGFERLGRGPGHSTSESLADGIGPEDKPPLAPLPILKACPFFADAAVTGGKGHEQGLWMQTALACTFMENGRQVFHGLSYGDPRYNSDTVDAMFDRKLAEREEKDMGWPQCRTFEQYGSQQCAGCPHRGKIRSPLNLPIVQPAPEPTPAGPVSQVEGLWIPKPYFVDSNTGFVTYEKEIAKGIMEEIPVLKYKITDIWAQDTGINFTVDRELNGFTDAVIKYEDLNSDTTISSAFNRQRITVHNPKITGAFMKTLIEEYQKRKKALTTIPFGWWTDEGATDPGGWAYGGLVRKEDGTTMPSSKGDPSTAALYAPRGEKDIWFKALELVTAQHRPDVEIITAVAFASPLLRFTGHFSGTLVARSNSGGNKSTAVNVGGAVWGHPRKTKFTATASSVGIRLRMSQIVNLPSYWDDIHKDQVERAADLLVELTQGADGLKGRADRTLHETGSWQAILCICANGSMFDHFAMKNKSDAAGLYRIFEYTVSEKETAKGGRIAEWDATYLQQQLEENFGRIGEQYSKMLAHASHIKGMLRGTQEYLAKELKYAGQEQERFWFALVSTIILGAKLANELGASFHVEEIHQFLIKAYEEMREKVHEESPVGADAPNTEHAVTEFFQEYGGNMLWSENKIKKSGPNQHVKVINGPDKDETPVFIQWVTGERELRIQRNKFKEFLAAHKYTESAVVAGLKQHFGADTAHRANLSAGTNYTGGAMHLITIPVPPGSPFEEALLAHEPRKPASSQLKLVSPRPQSE